MKLMYSLEHVLEGLYRKKITFFVIRLLLY